MNCSVLCAVLVCLGVAGCAWNGGRGALDAFGVRLDNYDRHRPPQHFTVNRLASPGHRLLRASPSEAGWTDDGLTLTDLGDQVTSLVGHDQDESFDLTGSPKPLPDFWETVKRDLSDLPGVFWKDTKSVYTNESNLLLLGLTYGASLAIQETGPDETVEDSLRENRRIKGDFRDAAGILGNPGLHFGLAGLWYLVGQQKQDQKTYEVSTKLFRALLLTGASTLLGQAATWDDAPNGQWGTFPSGHTSSSFAFASVMHHEYGPLVGVPLYALSGFVAYARLEDRTHYLSDVIMGGVLGLVVGHTIAADGEPIELFGGRIVPYADQRSQSSGLAWVKQFK